MLCRHEEYKTPTLVWQAVRVGNIDTIWYEKRLWGTRNKRGEIGLGQNKFRTHELA